jgi:NitT/TauT family transport system permease protein
VDRTVPTWQSLYHDGLLRIVTPQGLGGREYWLWEDAKATFSRLACGLAVGILLASIIGLAMGCYSAIEAFLLPPLSFLAQIPPTAMLAVFFVLVGTQFPMFVTIIAFGMLPTLAQTIYQSAKNDVPDELINKADTLGASEFELIWEVIMRQILPRVIDAVRLQIGPALVLLVAAEWMVAGEGFGYRLRLFFQRTDMTVVFVYLFILGIFGFLLDTALVGLRRLRCPWFGE